MGCGTISKEWKEADRIQHRDEVLRNRTWASVQEGDDGKSADISNPEDAKR